MHDLAKMVRYVVSTTALCAALMPAPVIAQPQDVEQHTLQLNDAAPEQDETVWNGSLGGSLNTGNTRSWQVITSTDLRLMRGASGFVALASFAYGQADIKDDGAEDYKDTVKNFNAKLRYEYYLTRMDALFVSAGFRWDTFAGLDSRIQGQAGYLRNFFKHEAHRMWGELGYDITLDNYDPDPLPDPDNMGAFLDGDAVVHSGRVFLGYDNHINEGMTYLTGVEGLLNVEDAEDLRINWDNAVRSSIAGNFHLELKFTLNFDNVPVPGARKLDTATLVSLLYSLS